MDCCNPIAYRRFFNSDEAAENLKKYLKNGLNKIADRTSRHLINDGIEGHSVIDVGCGIGAFHVELLAAGAVSALGVEISAGYEVAAASLLEQRGLSDRVERIVVDFAEAGEEIPPADLVVLDRVVCCYPDWRKLLTSVTAHSTEKVAFSFPRDRWWTRIAMRLFNRYVRWRKVDFRAFVHPVDEMVAFVEAQGFTRTYETQGLFWQSVILNR